MASSGQLGAGSRETILSTLKTYDHGYEGRYAYNPRNTKQFA